MLVIMSFASHAQAAMTSLSFSCITSNDPSGSDCNTGMQQFSMDVIDLDSVNTHQVQFDFRNTGVNASSIEGIYFDDGTLVGISRLLNTDTGVSFSAGSATPNELPGANLINPVFQTTADFLADSNQPVAQMGINPGEWLGIIFELQSQQTYNDVINDLITGNLRVGLHAIAFNSGYSESFVNIAAVPLPPAIILLGSAVLMLFGRMSKAGRSDL